MRRARVDQVSCVRFCILGLWIWRGSDAWSDAVGRPEFEEGKGRSGLLVSSAGAVAAGNWIPMLKGGL